MRYATVVLTWTDDRRAPIDEAFADSDAVSIEAIRHLNPTEGDRYVGLFELRGDLGRARTLLDDAPAAIESDVVGEGERGVAYVQCRSVGLAADLLEVLREREIVVDWPIERVSGAGRGLEVTAVGTSEAIQRAAAALPDDVRLELRRLGEYGPRGAPAVPALTDRQRELFDLAVDEGYYEVPRETTHRELADMVDLSPGTVGEHLQRIEAELAAAAKSGPRSRRDREKGAE